MGHTSELKHSAHYIIVSLSWYLSLLAEKFSKFQGTFELENVKGRDSVSGLGLGDKPIINWY